MFVIKRVLDISQDAGGLSDAPLTQQHDLEVVILGHFGVLWLCQISIWTCSYCY